MDLEPTRRLIAAIIAAREARNYFTGAADKECSLRRLFVEMPTCLASYSRNKDAQHKAEKAWQHLNNFYRTRAPRSTAGMFIRCIAENVKATWPDYRPPPLLSEQPEQCACKISSLVPCILGCLKKSCGRQDYSLVTKFLHFTYPETYPIFDARVARAIEEWAYFTFRQLAERHNWKNYQALGDPTNYEHLVRFYATLWLACRQEEKMKLRSSAEEMSGIVGASVSVLDLIDKHLWRCAGNPVLLRLLD
ncbi:MAG: hypothetical protein FJ288_03995 [Planctomycetes bacterium]|nr:hypothetical protein [Planctomycetota bacterium]